MLLHTAHDCGFGAPAPDLALLQGTHVWCGAIAEKVGNFDQMVACALRAGEDQAHSGKGAVPVQLFSALPRLLCYPGCQAAGPALPPLDINVWDSACSSVLAASSR